MLAHNDRQKWTSKSTQAESELVRCEYLGLDMDVHICLRNMPS